LARAYLSQAEPSVELQLVCASVFFGLIFLEKPKRLISICELYLKCMLFEQYLQSLTFGSTCFITFAVLLGRCYLNPNLRRSGSRVRGYFSAPDGTGG
jgi:hypothetical protein